LIQRGGDLISTFSGTFSGTISGNTTDSTVAADGIQRRIRLVLFVCGFVVFDAACLGLAGIFI
jgi:hypothetical protein